MAHNSTTTITSNRPKVHMCQTYPYIIIISLIKQGHPHPMCCSSRQVVKVISTYEMHRNSVNSKKTHSYPIARDVK